MKLWDRPSLVVSSLWHTQTTICHAMCTGLRVGLRVVGLLPDENVALAERADAVRPPNAKRSDVKKILSAASSHFDELVELWEKNHDNA